MATEISTSKSPGDGSLKGFRIWVDIENPPQVQYLLPLAQTFQRRGADLVITARDYGITYELLEQQGIQYVPLGRHYGGRKLSKVVGNLRRTFYLKRLFDHIGRPAAVVSASRSAALAARSIGLPSFSLCDYEYVNLFVFRVAASYVVHPDVISVQTFVERGVRPERLVAYHGIKEDITFAGVDVDGLPAHVFPELTGRLETRVLVRPPAEESHYHRRETSNLARELLSRLALRPDTIVIFSPRYAWQVEALKEYDWTAPPVVVCEAASFVSLYKAVDAVVSGGGTMTREAAYLGIPAVSMFKGELGSVDRYLESTGRLTILRHPADLDRLDFRSLSRRPVLNANPNACDDVADAIVRIIRQRANSRQRPTAR